MRLSPRGPHHPVGASTVPATLPCPCPAGPDSGDRNHGRGPLRPAPRERIIGVFPNRKFCNVHLHHGHSSRKGRQFLDFLPAEGNFLAHESRNSSHCGNISGRIDAGQPGSIFLFRTPGGVRRRSQLVLVPGGIQKSGRPKKLAAAAGCDVAVFWSAIILSALRRRGMDSRLSLVCRRSIPALSHSPYLTGWDYGPGFGYPLGGFPDWRR